MNDDIRQVLDRPAAKRWPRAVQDAILALAEQAAPASPVTYLAPRVEAPSPATGGQVAPAPVRHQAPTLMPEQWITKPEIALALGVAQRTIERYVSEGMPCAGRRGGAVRFRRSECIAWREGRRTRGDRPDPQQTQRRFKQLRDSHAAPEGAAQEAPPTRGDASRLSHQAEPLVEQPDASDAPVETSRSAPADGSLARGRS